uniref:Uncharacterized protein n=1 Tax=Rhizophora mucronata TaxID=61149 RepID=A0A2P2PH41_RHIMU
MEAAVSAASSSSWVVVTPL